MQLLVGKNPAGGRRECGMWPSAENHFASREQEELTRWRQQRLERAGFDSELASRIASDGQFDLHALIGLVERGCPPPLAVRILAPLDRAG